MTLFQIDEKINQALTQGIDPETGELTNFEEIEALQMDRFDKVRNIGFAYKNAEAEVEALKKQKDIFSDRLDTAQKNLEHLKDYMKYATGGKKFSCDEFEVRYRKSESVQIAPDTVLPNEYLTEKTTYTPNKTALKSALKAGIVINGVELVQNSNISIK